MRTVLLIHLFPFLLQKYCNSLETSMLLYHHWLYALSSSFHLGDLICSDNLVSFCRCRYINLPQICLKFCQTASIANTQSSVLYNRRKNMKYTLIFSLITQIPSLIKAIIVIRQRKVRSLSMWFCSGCFYLFFFRKEQDIHI